jgi:hypothetical protein
MKEDKSMKGCAFVKNVADEQEAALVESILGVEGIPIRRNYKGEGRFLEIYMGSSSLGIDLYVPEETLELAKGLLESEVIDMPEETGREANLKAEEKYQFKRRSIVWIILLYIFLPVVAAIIFGIIFR